jgi:ABC-type glycerol-3-phosphate transport system substrate-binding protein
MFFDVTSGEFSEDWEINSTANYYQNHLRMGSTADGFNVKAVSNRTKGTAEVLLPAYEQGKALQTWGLAVNHNGKNIDLALEFVNGLLSSKVQMDMFNMERAYYYPVNSEIEGDIKKIEAQSGPEKSAVDLKDYALSQIKTPESGAYNPSADAVQDKIFKMIRKELFKLIFSSTPYSDEEIKKVLKELESKCNIYLNE